jgi:hypothetical protein
MPARKPRDLDAKPKKPDPLDGLPQIERFKIVAQELGCEDDEATFRAKLAPVLRHRPKVEPGKQPKKE